MLGAIGPAAIRALVNVPSSRAEALEQIVAMEPRTEIIGQDLGEWHVWRPEDDRVAPIRRSIALLVPRLVGVMEQDTRAQRPAAYLLERWGTGITRERGMTMLSCVLVRVNGNPDFLAGLRMLQQAPPSAAAHHQRRRVALFARDRQASLVA